MKISITAFQNIRSASNGHSPLSHEELVRLDDDQALSVFSSSLLPVLRPCLCHEMPLATHGLSHGIDYTFDRSKAFWSHDSLVYDLFKEVLGVVCGYDPLPAEDPLEGSTGVAGPTSAVRAAILAGDGPFHSLLVRQHGDFNSNTCVALVKDFALFEDAAKACDIPHFYSHHFSVWRDAFEFAGPNGLVRVEHS